MHTEVGTPTRHTSRKATMRSPDVSRSVTDVRHPTLGANSDQKWVVAAALLPRRVTDVDFGPPYL